MAEPWKPTDFRCSQFGEVHLLRHYWLVGSGDPGNASFRGRRLVGTKNRFRDVAQETTRLIMKSWSPKNSEFAFGGVDF
ncbi:hypothetical protein HPP92_026175 [Vanilla planifolia]|uniref:Uncharacterized protein n=1 Tax=Vanilla planifolia TaxID=51239 RepID=A0A835PEH7_VANPL|nr:hypothetical protein HPP92_026386 [Vanilla planifolia]KAG0451564.1 hypothetical protein HPP92_026175 [Vanilla planifolia]